MTSPTSSQKKQRPVWAETLGLLVIAVVLAAVIKTFFVQAFYIPSESMEPLFVKNDRILVEKVSLWGSGSLHRGDVVVFRDPGHWLRESPGPGNPLTRGLTKVGLYPSGGHLVKRVIGVGGDHVVCCDTAGRVTVNGKPVAEKSYLPQGVDPSAIDFDVTVPRGKLWVMGDNRSNSEDSRYHQDDATHGFVDDDLVVGKVWALIWPWNRMRWV